MRITSQLIADGPAEVLYAEHLNSQRPEDGS